MLVFQQSEAGTIRDQNQDILLSREDQGIFILADGEGVNGRQVATQAAERLSYELLRLKAQPSTTYAANALPRLLQQTARELQQSRLQQPELVGTSVSLAVCFIHEANLLLATTGRAGALAYVSGTTHCLEPRGIPPLATTVGDDRVAGMIANPDAAIHGSVWQSSEQESASEEDSAITLLGPTPLQVGDWIILCSQGLLISQPLSEMASIAPALHEDAETLANALFRRASARYDGDDRSLALLRFLPTDLQRRFPPEKVVSVDFDRHWKVPMWVPMAVLSTAAALGWWLKKRLFEYVSPE